MAKIYEKTHSQVHMCSESPLSILNHYQATNSNNIDRSNYT